LDAQGIKKIHGVRSLQHQIAHSIVLAIDIHLSVAQTKHAQNCSCVKITTVQMPNVT